MTQFWIAALALGLVAAAFVLVPVVRSWVSQEGAERSSAALGVGIVIALAIPVVSIILYSGWTTWDWDSGGMQASDTDGMHEMNQALAALEQRLVDQPQDLESWALLGRTYMSMRRFGDAANAFRQAAALDGNQSPQILADFGEALALSDPEGLQGEAGAVIERVLALSPAHPKGLWYGGLNAYENGNWTLAEQRLGQLLTLDPPETLVPLIEERIAEARARAGGELPALAAAEADAADAEPETAAAAPEPQPTETQAPEEAEAAPVAAGPAMDPGEGIQLEVSLDPALAARISSPARVFIIARSVGGGPPLAVIPTTSDQLPTSLVLTDGNAMMEGVTILDQPELELVARVSLSGSPAQRPGDLFGAVNYARGNGPVRITIDRVAE